MLVNSPDELSMHKFEKDMFDCPGEYSFGVHLDDVIVLWILVESLQAHVHGQYRCFLLASSVLMPLILAGHTLFVDTGRPVVALIRQQSTSVPIQSQSGPKLPKSQHSEQLCSLLDL